MPDINITDVARLANVSVSTVSRVLNDHPDVSPATKARVKEVIDKYSYVPNNSARSLKQDSVCAVGVLIKGITNPFFSRMIEVMENEFSENNYSMILHQVQHSENEADAAIRLVKEKKPRGLIFLGGNFEQSQQKLNRIGVPFVLTTITALKNVDRGCFSSVTIDDYTEAYRVIDRICRAGHRRIGMIAFNQRDKSISRLRLDGYLAALRDNKIAVDDDFIDYADNYSMEAGYRSAERLLKRADFTCLFCISDSLAIGACRAIKDAGRRIPEDISVVGFDGIEMAKYYIPSLATVRQPDIEMAQASVRIILDCMDRKKPHQHMQFRADFIEGESFRPLTGY